MTSTPKHTPQDFLRVWDIALEIGWRFNKERDTYLVVPPDRFACRTWACETTPTDIGGIIVYVPNWFWNIDVMTTGTRREPPMTTVATPVTVVTPTTVTPPT